MTKKKLLLRIRSLESYLGISYVAPDGKDTFDEHIESSYGLTIKKRLEKLEEKLNINKNKK